MTKANTIFRSDINGLRAWAVTAVVLYHFGVPGFSGGFIGVDVFFVISGFLMTAIIMKGLDADERSQFSVINFYMARARRILPALIVLCLVLLLLGYFLLLPLDYKMLSIHSILSVLFFSNIRFWGEAGYFDVQSHEKWLLHTWSLAAEWQFYLLLPLLMMLAWKLRPGRKTITAVITAVLIASLALSIAITATHPSAAFYLLPTRAWEMLAGGLVFLLGHRSIVSARLAALLEAIGFALIIGSLVGFDSTSSWPGWRALIPVIGASLVLLTARSNSSWTNAPGMQWMGTRSYSLYLWHWPIVVALTYCERQNDPIFITAGLVLTLILGHLSYHWVESPSRRQLNKLSIAKSAAGLLAGVFIVTATGFGIYSKQGIYGRFDSAIELISQESLNKNPRRDACIMTAGVASPSCTFGGTSLQVILVGDSHAEAAASALVAAAPSPDSKIMEWSYSACPFIKGVQSEDRKQCGAFVDWALLQLKTVPPNVPVVIINRYAQFAFGANEDKSRENIPQIYFTKRYPIVESAFLEEYSKNLVETVCAIAKEREVYLVRPFPEMGINVPNKMARSALLGLQAKGVSVSLASYHQRQDFIWKAQDIAHDQCGIKILDPLPYLCSDGKCNGDKDGRPLYRDDNHLSEYGNKLLVPMFKAVFKENPAPLS